MKQYFKEKSNTTNFSDHIQYQQRPKRSTASIDAEYLHLAKDPEANREKLQAMVDEAAKAAGYKKQDGFYVVDSFTPRYFKKNLTNKAYKLGEAFRENGIGADARRFSDLERYIWRNSDEHSRKFEIDGEQVSLYDLAELAPYDEAYSHVLSTYFLSGYEKDYLPAPKYVFAQRIGRIRENDSSFNSRDQYYENGVSVLGVYEDGKYVPQNDGTFELFNSGKKYIVWGLLGAYRGADGEHLLNNAQVVGESESVIKSADPVTYDEGGNVIPLSERFNECVRMG